MRSLVGSLLLLYLAAPATEGAIRRRRMPLHQGSSGASLRKRIHINSLITQEGTVEVETGGNASLTGDAAGAFVMPTVIKFTPKSTQTEYNVSFDGLAREVSGSTVATHFSDRVTAGVTHEFSGWRGVSVAAGPQVSIFTRGSEGVRWGGVGLARVKLWGSLDGGITAAFSQATHSSDINPPRLLDLGGGFGRKLSARVTAHANYLYEKATGYSPQHSLYEGVEFQFTPRFALDVSVQQIGVGGPVLDHQLVAGLTMNLGRPGSWLRPRR